MPLSDSVVQEIRRVLAKRDIEGLIEAGAPRDEYDSEARELAFKWQQIQQPSRDVIYEWLRATWAIKFELNEDDLRKREGAFRATADDIYAAGDK